MTDIAIALLGWLAGVLVNHAANVLPLRESLWQRPFCKRRRDDGPEFISTARLGDASPAEAVYCHAPRPLSAWSALAAYLTGHARCAVCGKSTGPRAVLVEVATPILFWLVYRQYGLSAYLPFVLAYTAILVLLTVTDLEHRLIQHIVMLPALLLAAAGSFFAPHFGWQRAVLGGAIGFAAFYLFALIGRGALGEGDVVLAAFLGLITAFPNVVLALVYGILLGGVVSGLLLLTRRATLKTFIPYGPFLMVAGWGVLVWGDALARMVWR